MRFFNSISLLALLLFTPGCEIGRSWFSMSSDSPSPWLGIDLLPKRRTSQVTPHPTTRDSMTGAAKAGVHSVENRASSGVPFSKELHLPSIPAFFDGDPVEELSFRGPEGAFAR